MSRTISLYSSAPIKSEAFLRFVADMGGDIHNQEEISGGVASGDCHVWFYNVREQLAGKFEEPEESVVERLGAPVTARVDIHLSHHEGSGPLALQFAHRFAKRWPAVGSMATYRSFTEIDAAQMLNGPRIPPILGASLWLFFLQAPDAEAAISAFDGMVIDRKDPAWVNSALSEIRAIDGAAHDPSCEEILGFIPAGPLYAWIFRETLAPPGDGPAMDVGEELIANAASHLGVRPSWTIRVLLGYGAPSDSERAALTFSEGLLRAMPGIGIGLFEWIFDLEALSEIIELGRETIVA